MDPVTVDTDVILPGLLGSGAKRKFLFVLIYGALCHRIDSLRDEEEAMQQFAQEHGGTFHPGPTEQRVEALENARASVLDRLPHGTPDDWQLCLSSDTLDEYLHKIQQIGPALNVDALGAADGIGFWRRFIAQMTCVYHGSSFENVPRVVAIRFESLVPLHLNTASFDLHDIDGSWMFSAVRAMQAAPA